MPPGPREARPDDRLRIEPGISIFRARRPSWLLPTWIIVKRTRGKPELVRAPRNDISRGVTAWLQHELGLLSPRDVVTHTHELPTRLSRRWLCRRHQAHRTGAYSHLSAGEAGRVPRHRHPCRRRAL